MTRDLKTLGRVASIGAGNMAEAILRGVLDAGVAASDVLASDPSAEQRAGIEQRLGISTTESNAEAARFGDVVLLAVKPAVLEPAVQDVTADADTLFVSILAGRTLEALRGALGPQSRVVRAMPNTPALIGSGIAALAEESAPGDLDTAERLLGAVGRVVRVAEAELDAVTAVSGSGPAYVYAFVEALWAAGEAAGLSPEIARTLAQETAVGAARMVVETGELPSVLRERVSSPGGTTLAGLAALDQEGFSRAIAAAVEAATRRSRELARGE